MIQILSYTYMNGTKSTPIDHGKFIKDYQELNRYKESLRQKHKADAVFINHRVI